MIMIYIEEDFSISFCSSIHHGTLAVSCTSWYFTTVLFERLWRLMVGNEQF